VLHSSDSHNHYNYLIKLILDTLNTNDYVVIIYGSTVVLNADPLQIIITTTVSITTDTLGDLGKTQKRKKYNYK
jgi:hypothetical protein